MKHLFRTPWIARLIFSGRTWGFSSPDTVFLTFDDGPSRELTPWILNYLKEENIKGTFFCVGSNALRLPELMDQLRSEGHQIGNHTMRHEKGTETSYPLYRASIDEAAAQTDAKIFRPPYGRLPWKYARKIRRDYCIVMWSWLSYDFDAEVSLETILTQAERIRPGDIIVLHDNIKVQERLQELLPKLIALLKAKGYRFGLISA